VQHLRIGQRFVANGLQRIGKGVQRLLLSVSSARSSAPRARLEGNSSWAGGNRNRSAAWRCRARAHGRFRMMPLPRTRACASDRARWERCAVLGSSDSSRSAPPSRSPRAARPRQHADVGVRPHQHAEIAIERLDPADALLGHHQVIVRPVALVVVAPPWTAGSSHEHSATIGPGRNGTSFSHTPTAPRPSAAAVRRGKGLVQLKCITSNPMSPGLTMPMMAFRFARRVHQPAAAVDHLCDRFHVLVEQAQCIRVGQHQPAHRVVAQPAQRLQVHVAVARPTAPPPPAGRSSTSWPDSCRARCRHDDPRALRLAPPAVIGAHDQHPVSSPGLPPPAAA